MVYLACGRLVVELRVSILPCVSSLDLGPARNCETERWDVPEVKGEGRGRRGGVGNLGLLQCL